MKKGENNLSFEIPSNILNKGRYFVSVSIGIHRVKWITVYESCLGFDIDFVTKNNNLLQANKRDSVIAPILKWEID